VPASILTSDLLLAQNVQPKATAPGVGQESQPTPSGGGQASSPLASFMPILMMLVIFVPFFLLMSRRQKKEASARASLKKGDRVSTTAGLIGELVEMDDRIAKVKIAPGVTVPFLASTVSPFVESSAKGTSTPVKELKEAKAGSDTKK
jgi:preprotein translocase subunit YajC